MKINRQAVYNKYSGHCAYCGKVITLKEMQVDHIVPKARGWKLSNVNDYSNLASSCLSCNHYKRQHSLEGFRKHYIGKLHKRLAKLYIVRVALDYKIVTLQKWDRRFYFEMVNSETEQER